MSRIGGVSDGFFPTRPSVVLLQSCYGVELLEGLRNASSPMLNRWRKEEVNRQMEANTTVDDVRNWRTSKESERNNTGS